jgi:hypothetical protein
VSELDEGVVDHGGFLFKILPLFLLVCVVLCSPCSLTV